MQTQHRLRDQVRRNAVALISLVVALWSLGYNTWRNEQTEQNRNTRHAGFELLMQAGRMREILYHLRYDAEAAGESSLRSGWVVVLSIENLAMLLDAPTQESAARLREAWSANWSKIDNDSSKDSVEQALDDFQSDTLAMLRTLD